MRTVAVTGRTDHIPMWVADRQSGDWAERTLRAGLARPPAPTAAPQAADPAQTRRRLTELRDSGVLTDAEVERLRARAGV